METQKELAGLRRRKIDSWQFFDLKVDSTVENLNKNNEKVKYYDSNW